MEAVVRMQLAGPQEKLETGREAGKSDFKVIATASTRQGDDSDSEMRSGDGEPTGVREASTLKRACPAAVRRFVF